MNESGVKRKTVNRGRKIKRLRMTNFVRMA